METKKGHHLFIMLAILIAHTVVLTLWLSKEEPVQKQANFKFEKPALNLMKATNFKDSVGLSQQGFNTDLGISAK